MDNSKPAPADYEVTQAREIGGVHRAVGETVTLTPLQAKYYLPPYGTGLKAVAAMGAAKSKTDAEKPATKGDKAEG
ncbi:hypothetical protein R1T40_08620 [Tritonibacter scottomollicae]|uniref:Uncharacterized protein n=1 Tax=Tritonibacter scottomollicae TaxID=483013 RepID=A0ABZ0HKV2_TRISK|nr:hypothetical protein [Tritonibacter scottomollicae]WOI34774.1 hypothetical protein R1T40_08620 [Tritonibacter scottomollicae]